MSLLAAVLDLSEYYQLFVVLKIKQLFLEAYHFRTEAKE